MERRIDISGSSITYTLERKRVKNINLRVRGGRVFVSAARWVPVPVIESFMRSRGEFILSALRRSAAAVPEHSFEDGGRFYYLGRGLTLRIFYGARASVTVAGDELRVCVRDGADGAQVERAIGRWYRSESERLCRAACGALRDVFAARGVPECEIKMRVMRSCWGNCRPRTGTVTFNARLAAVPYECIEYVAAHELTHFLYADHSAAFYAALAEIMPDWKPRRALIKKYAPLVL